jgi:hypothetical protein
MQHKGGEWSEEGVSGARRGVLGWRGWFGGGVVRRGRAWYLSGHDILPSVVMQLGVGGVLPLPLLLPLCVGPVGEHHPRLLSTRVFRVQLHERDRERERERERERDREKGGGRERERENREGGGSRCVCEKVWMHKCMSTKCVDAQVYEHKIVHAHVSCIRTEHIPYLWLHTRAARQDIPSMRKGCATFGVNKWSDVFMRDGKALRREIREGGEWENKVVDRKTGSEWVMKVKERVLVHFGN